MSYVNSKIQIPSACPPVLALTGTENVLGAEPLSCGKCGNVATIPAEVKLSNDGCIVIRSGDAADVATTELPYFTSTFTVAARSPEFENHDANKLTEQVPTPLGAFKAPQVALWKTELSESSLMSITAANPVSSTCVRPTSSET